MQLHNARKVVRDNLGDEDAISEVARDVALWPRQRTLVNPLVQLLELVLLDVLARERRRDAAVTRRGCVRAGGSIGGVWV